LSKLCGLFLDRYGRVYRIQIQYILARDSICYSALYAIARPYLRPSVTRVDQSTRCHAIAGRTARCAL